MEGKLVIFSAPSGSGKSTIVRHLMSRKLNLAFSISATSRKPREGEADGREYHFLSLDAFRDQIQNEAFVEWEEVYPDQYYGTLHSELERIWALGQHAVFDIDVLGGLNLKKKFGPKACAIFISPPSLEVLEQRLRKRASDEEESLQKRLEKADYEMQYARKFDHVLLNERLDPAKTEAENLVREFLGL